MNYIFKKDSHNSYNSSLNFDTHDHTRMYELAIETNSKSNISLSYLKMFRNECLNSRCTCMYV